MEKTYFIEQRRTIEVKSDNPENALHVASQAFGAYQITDHPDVIIEGPKIIEHVFENLPMHVNLADSMDVRAMHTVIGRAEGFRDLVTRQTKLEIFLGPSESQLFDQMTEIVELKAVGFAGFLKNPRNPPNAE